MNDCFSKIWILFGTFEGKLPVDHLIKSNSYCPDVEGFAVEVHIVSVYILVPVFWREEHFSTTNTLGLLFSLQNLRDSEICDLESLFRAAIELNQ